MRFVPGASAALWVNVAPSNAKGEGSGRVEYIRPQAD